MSNKQNLLFILRSLLYKVTNYFQPEMIIDNNLVTLCISIINMIDAKYLTNSTLVIDQDGSFNITWVNANLKIKLSHYEYRAEIGEYLYVRKGLTGDLSNIVYHVSTTVK